MEAFHVEKGNGRPMMYCRKPWKSIALILFLGVLTAASAAATTWITSETDKDLLTGQNYSYLRIASGLSGTNRRFLDILKGPHGYQMRFVVPQPTNTQTTIWAPGVATSRSARDLGDTVSWMVEGKTAHTVSPALNKQKRHLGVTDYEASWPVTCSDLTELLTGKTLRVVMPEFNGEWDLSQLPKSFEKIIGVAPKKIVQATAPECTAVPNAPQSNDAPSQKPSP